MIQSRMLLARQEKVSGKYTHSSRTLFSIAKDACLMCSTHLTRLVTCLASRFYNTFQFLFTFILHEQSFTLICIL